MSAPLTAPLTGRRTPPELLPAVGFVVALLLTIAPHLSGVELLPAEHAVPAAPLPIHEVAR